MSFSTHATRRSATADRPLWKWGVDCAVLVAIGVGNDGKRSVLGVSSALSEAEPPILRLGRSFLQSLLARGLHGVRMTTSDDHAGLRAAREAVFASIPWQRCQFHLIRNAFAHVPKQSMRSEAARDIRTILDAPDPGEAKRRTEIAFAKYDKIAPNLANWIDANVAEALTVLTLPPEHRRRLRTSNAIERVNPTSEREIKRRTRVATLFPNAESLLRLVSAVLAEIDPHSLGRSGPPAASISTSPRRLTEPHAQPRPVPRRSVTSCRQTATHAPQRSNRQIRLARRPRRSRRIYRRGVAFSLLWKVHQTCT